MENLNQPLDSGFADRSAAGRLVVTGSVRQAWREIAGWSLFFAIMLFVVLGFMVLAVLVAGSVETAAFAGLFPVLLFGLLFFFPGWYLFKFATLLRQGLASGDNGRITEGFSNFRILYRFTGILLLILVGFYALIFLIGLMVAGSSF